MRGGGYRYLIVGVLLCAAGAFVALHADLVVPLNRPFAEFPREIGEWRMVGEETFDQPTLDVLRPTDYLSRTYVDHDNSRVRLYVGYHGGGPASGEIHSPKNCLPGSGWYQVSSVPTRIDLGGGKSIAAVRAVYQKGGLSELFTYWYQVRDQALTSEYLLKLAQVTSSLRWRRRDAAFVRISVPGSRADEALAQTVAADFTKSAYPAIREFLPK